MIRRLPSTILVLGATAVVAAVPTAALACSFAAPEPHTLDAAEQAADFSPPGAVTASVVDVARGVAPRGAGCGGRMSTSCDDIGRVSIAVTAPADDRTPAADMGYELTLAAGTLPAGLVLPEEAIRAAAGSILLIWTDGATDDQERIDFTLTITAVDLAGNRGPVSELLRVRHAGGLLVLDRQRARPLPGGAAGLVLLVLAAGRAAARRSGRRALGSRRRPVQPSIALCPVAI